MHAPVDNVTLPPPAPPSGLRQSLGVIVFIIGYGIRRLIFDRQRPSPDLGQPPQRLVTGPPA
jgi:hypothetical protein